MQIETEMETKIKTSRIQPTKRNRLSVLNSLPLSFSHSLFLSPSIYVTLTLSNALQLSFIDMAFDIFMFALIGINVNVFS